MSYAREDRALVERLASGLQRLRHEVWMDRRLEGGQEWWAVILEQIRACDAIVVALSPALLESAASASERTYARQLGKAILPVAVRPIRTELLPPDLAPLQMVNYCNPSADADFELADTLAQMPVAPPLPDPLPAAPPTPVSYFADLAEQVHRRQLSLDEQLAVVGRLRAALSNESDRQAALELLIGMRRRDDLYYAPARDIENVVAQLGGLEAVVAELGGTSESRTEASGNGSTSAAVAPAGWYADPTGRHKLRYFNQQWTEWASDGGSVIEDRLTAAR